MQTKRPIIGVLPDHKEGGLNRYSLKDHYAIRENYIDSIIQAGGLPIVLVYDYEAIDYYLDLIDGLYITGGMDINPARYGDDVIHPTIKLNLPRENFEFKIVEKALKTDLPIFGICNGMQLINILHGGKLIQHIPDDPKFMDHEQGHFEDFKNYSKGYHEIIFERDSKIFEIIKCEKLLTNSSHHQAISSLGSQLKITARTNDGIIEAIEKPDHPFCIGVQWHPEYKSSQAEGKLFEAFVSASLSRKNSYRK